MAAMADVNTIAEALFGGYVDISKMDPGPSDVHVMGGGNRAVLIPKRTGRRATIVRKDNRVGRHILEGTGIAATGIGGVLGLREVGEAAGELGHPGVARGVSQAAKIIPVGVRRTLSKPKVRLGAVAGMLAGDAIATGEQVRQVRRPQAGQPVAKAALNDLVQGIIHNSRLMTAAHAPEVVSGTKEIGAAAKPVAERKAIQHAGRVKATKPLVQSYGGSEGANERLNWLRENRTARQARPAQAAVAAKPKPTGTDRAIQAGQVVRRDLGTFAGTGTGKAVIGGAGIAAGAHLLSRRSQPQQPYDPYFGKRASRQVGVTFSGTFSKFDDDKRLAFGWANVSKVNGIPIVDRQGDHVAIEDIEDAAYTYVEGSRVGGDMHKRVGGKFDGAGDRPHHVADLVESMVFDDAKCDALGLPDDFPRGWWVGFRVFDDDVWEMAKDGRRTGFSIHGKGIRKNVDYDALMSA